MTGDAQKQGRIMVVDDEPSILALLSTILRKAGYSVETARNGAEAMEKITAAEYDVVLLDLMMPVMSGFELLRQLPVEGARTGFVIIMSATSKDAIADAVDVHVFATLRKPFDNAEVLGTIEACLAASRLPDPGVSSAA